MKHQIGVLLLFLLIGCGIPTASYKISLQTVERPVDAKERYGQHKIATKHEGGIWVYIIEDEMVKISWRRPGMSHGWPPPTFANVTFHFTLLNKTNRSIKIIWEEAAFVDKEAGRSYRVESSERGYIGRLLFSLDLTFQSDLDNGTISKGLRQKFEDNRIPLSQSATIWIEEGGSRWLITEDSKRHVLVKKETDKLNVYTEVNYPQLGIIRPQDVITYFFIPEYYVFPITGENIQYLTKPYISKTYQVLLPIQIENIVYKYIFTFRVDDVVVHRLE